ncbi:hypothetical protein QBK99_13270 [Corticibacterium sp. UT-5YL-CI-8]|nr:hypothetical protein [Tianweitania sp. UT-5YL-CI-8]
MIEFRRNDPVFIDPQKVKAVAVRKGETSILADRWHAVHGSPTDAIGLFPSRPQVRFNGPFADDCGSHFWIVAAKVATVEAMYGEPPTDVWGNELPAKLECVDVKFQDGAALALQGDPTEIAGKLR